MVRLCCRCNTSRAVLRRPKTFEQVCRECFYEAFEEEVHQTIVSNKLFSAGERVAIAASGGKDSTVLAHVITTLNKRHNYGLDLFLLSIDEGISGYRDDSLETVKRNEQQYGIPLEIVSYKQLYGWTMDEIVAQIGKKNNCTFCGVFRRQALDRGAAMMRADKIVTGHNADDVAETVLLNLIRGDVPRLSRCANITTGEGGSLPRCKPFKYCYEKEIVMYAYFKKLDYFSTECIYAPFAARGFAREFVKDLEAARPAAIIDVIRSAENFRITGVAEQTMPKPRQCERCGYICSQPVCKACVLLEGLNQGLPNLGISRTRGNKAAGRRATLHPSIQRDAAAQHNGTSLSSVLAPVAQPVHAQSDGDDSVQVGAASVANGRSAQLGMSSTTAHCDGDASTGTLSTQHAGNDQMVQGGGCPVAVLEQSSAQVAAAKDVNINVAAGLIHAANNVATCANSHASASQVG